MKLSRATVGARLLDAAIQFGRNEKALREERRAEWEHPCEFKSSGEPEVGDYGVAACYTLTEEDFPSVDWCENCRIRMELRKNRTGNRRLRQLAKERIVRLVKRLDS